MPLSPVPKRLAVKTKISICGSGRALQRLHGCRGRGCGEQGRFRGLGLGGGTGFVQVGFRCRGRFFEGQITGFNFSSTLDACILIEPPRQTLQRRATPRHCCAHTLDSGDTSSPLALSAPLQDFVRGVPLAVLLEGC